MPISSGETTTIQESSDRDSIVTNTVETFWLYYDSDGDGEVDGRCKTQEIDTDYLRQPHPSHALRDEAVWEDDYINCPPAP